MTDTILFFWIKLRFNEISLKISCEPIVFSEPFWRTFLANKITTEHFSHCLYSIKSIHSNSFAMSHNRCVTMKAAYNTFRTWCGQHDCWWFSRFRFFVGRLRFGFVVGEYEGVVNQTATYLIMIKIDIISLRMREHVYIHCRRSIPYICFFRFHSFTWGWTLKSY